MRLDPSLTFLIQPPDGLSPRIHTAVCAGPSKLLQLKVANSTYGLRTADPIDLKRRRRPAIDGRHLVESILDIENILRIVRTPLSDRSINNDVSFGPPGIDN